MKPNNIKRAITFKLAIPLGIWEKDRESKQIPCKLCLEDQDDTKYECRAITGRIKASYTAPAQSCRGC